MQRRTILQGIAAFIASLAGWFGFGQHQPFELVRLKGTRGLVSPKAQWFPSPTYKTVQTLAHDSQEGIEVMRLKNPPCRKVTMGVPEGPPPEYVNPAGPVARASDVWQPLETFQIMAPMAGGVSPTLLGTMRNPAKTAPVDISNDTVYKDVTGHVEPFSLESLQDKPPPTEEALQKQAERRAVMDANYEELLANWDSQKFDPADMDRAFESSIEERFSRLNS